MSDRITLRQLDIAAPQAVAHDSPGVVAVGRRASLNFALSLATGEDVENNLGAAPLSCVIGDGSLLPSVEAVLMGLGAGATVDVMLPPEHAFGHRNDDNVQKIPLYRFPPDLALSQGLMVDFTDQRVGYSQAGVVRDFDKHYVTVDFNHPLAGRSLRFRAVIHAVE
ncbi:MAG: FKBP-type peptidyl-prolyl cis-trans isomerase [Pseudomonadales bacterium]|jgi:FKBP-type peptidyl-prolyl cis-trans isomerase SlpA|nr:FKBP-type peptidyl-prolyl cis-trans isomerase [Pseudomonadales bacterium]